MSQAPNQPPQLVLASASPQRSALLRGLGLDFTVDPCPLREPAPRSREMPPERWAEALAYFKARAVSARWPGARVLGADTIVSCENQILGKPFDRLDAERMLQLQAGRHAAVITGVCLIQPDRTRTVTHAVTHVWMRDLPEERDRYLDSGLWRDKAGAYGIQDLNDRMIERLEGSFSNVVGLPTELVTTLLAA